MEQSSKSRFWYLLHSLWVIALFFPLGLLAPFSFIYIGYRVKQRKWLRFGLIYLIPVYVGFILLTEFDEENIVSDIGVGVSLLSWIYIIIHGLAVRHEFIQLLIAHEQTGQYKLRTKQTKTLTETKYKKKQKKHILGKMEKPNESVRKSERSKQQEEIKVININVANEEEIAQLPSVPPFLAKKIIEKRNEVGSFTSIEHLARVTNIKPHILMRSRAYILFSDKELVINGKVIKEEEKPKKKGRIVDY